jgi:hypothetical protein
MLASFIAFLKWPPRPGFRKYVSATTGSAITGRLLGIYDEDHVPAGAVGDFKEDIEERGATWTAQRPASGLAWRKT